MLLRRFELRLGDSKSPVLTSYTIEALNSRFCHMPYIAFSNLIQIIYKLDFLEFFLSLIL